MECKKCKFCNQDLITEESKFNHLIDEVNSFYIYGIGKKYLTQVKLIKVVSFEQMVSELNDIIKNTDFDLYFNSTNHFNAREFYTENPVLFMEYIHERYLTAHKDIRFYKKIILGF